MRASISDPIDTLSRRLPSLSWQTATLLVLLVGVLLRIWVYALGSSFWLDEAMVFLNMQNRSYLELAEPLDYHQMAPIGWLFLHKAMIDLFGGSEYSLRLPALLFGVSAVVICYAAAKKHLDKYGVFLATVLIALLPPVLKYAVVLKPYTVDVFFASAVIALTFNALRRHDLSRPTLAALFLTGVAGIFLSLPVVIVLASSGLALCLKTFQTKNFRDLIPLTALGSLWLLVFAYVYVTIHGQPSDVTSWMREDAWTGAFAPIPFSSLSSLLWYPSTLQNVMAFWFTDEGSFFAIALVVLGLISLCVSGRSAIAAFLALPTIVALIVSMFNLYPFSGRLIVYLIPSAIFAVAFGFDYLMRETKGARFAPLLFGGVFCLAVAWRTFSMSAQPGEPFNKDNVHPALEILTAELQPDDMLYVYYGALPAFWVYRDRYDGLRDVETMFGRSPRVNRDCNLLDLDKLQMRGRVWAFFSAHTWGRDRLKEDALFLNDAKGIADVIVDHVFPEVRLVLLDFNRTQERFEKRLSAVNIPDDAECRRYWAAPIPD